MSGTEFRRGDIVSTQVPHTWPRIAEVVSVSSRTVTVGYAPSLLSHAYYSDLPAEMKGIPGIYLRCRAIEMLAKS